jgi:hypothetical protein
LRLGQRVDEFFDVESCGHTDIFQLSDYGFFTPPFIPHQVILLDTQLRDGYQGNEGAEFYPSVVLE